ncbi:SbcC/MukB-like Walker B domain-containing protein [Parvibaculum sp.]|uniref:SbcC/MukB-like Walker B domain-containing protein n=1 Tax=Parvibaculum sp. TaxID=2024848 RepID=UPI000C892DD3|nr:SbcC/MukB-like Walker B domain-containing protein [Parvibaculum sp.]MAB13921.1 hypothetical protein [Parvibaculum sp.]
MKLSRIFAMNWYSYPLLEVDVVGVTALLGKNGSGKSTLLDMMQVVLSGANMRLTKFNIATGEGKSRQSGERRTLKGYVLGKLANEEEAYLRNEETQTLVALVFEDEETRKYVTIGVALEAEPKDTTATVRALFVVDGARIEKSDVGAIDGEAFIPFELDEVLERLHEKGVEAGGEGLDRAKDWKSYCQSYLYLLSGKRRSYQEGEIKQLLKTLHKALAVTGQAENPTEFVRQYILEDDPIDLRGLRSSVDRFRELRNHVELLRQRLNWLQPLSRKCAEYREELEAQQTMGPIVDLARWCDLKRRVLEGQRDERNMMAREDALNETIGKIESRKREASEELVAVRRQLNADGADTKRSEAQLRIKQAQYELVQARENANNHYKTLMQRLPRLSGEWLENHTSLRTVAGTLADSLRGRRPHEWADDAMTLEPDLARFFDLLQKAAPDHERITTKVRVDANHVEERKRAAESELREAREGRIQVSPQVRAFQAQLKGAGIDSKLLFEAVEVVRPDWLPSAEALLGWDREGVVVAAGQVQQAFQIYKSLRRDEARDVRIFATQKLEDQPDEAPAESLASVVTSDDPIVRKILVSRLGRVRLAASTADFDEKGRSVLQVQRDGELRIIFDDGLTVRDMQVLSPKLGKGAAAANIPRLEAEVTALTRELSGLAGQLAELQKIERDIQALVDLADSRRPLTDDAELMKALHKRLADAQEEYERIGDLIDPELQAKEKDLLGGMDALDRDLDDQKDVRSKLRERLAIVRSKLEGEVMRPGLFAQAEEAREKFLRNSGQFGTTNGERVLSGLVRMHDFARRMGCGRKYTNVTEKAEDRRLEADREVIRLRGEIRESDKGIGRYFIEFALARPESDFETIQSIGEYVDAEVARIRDNVLLEKEREMRHAAESAEDIFKKEFLGQIQSRLDATDKAVRDLNKNLSGRVFINKTYRFSSHMAPNLAPIVRLAKKAQEDASFALPLFRATGSNDDEYEAAFEIIEQMLEDDAMDLTYYEDYRNYNVFDLISKDVSTGYETNSSDRAGTGSGGELGAPAYIAIGAALAAVYYGSVKSVEAPFGVAMFDEAFLRLDGPTQRKLIDFFGSLQLQTILAAPPDKRQVVAEVVDTILDIRRSDKYSYVKPMYLKEGAREALRKENPDNWNEEELQKRMASEAAE